MSENLLAPYGSFLPALWYHGLRDRLRGNRARAYGRWGFLRPPGSQGKVVWIRCGATRESVRLGIELLRAIRAKRLDIRLILTFEEEYPDLLVPLEELNRTGWGYGPCDHPAAVARAMERLAPYGVIFAGVPPGKHLARTLEQRARTLVVAADAPNSHGRFEYIYPATESQAATWNGQAHAPVVDLMSLLTEAQVDPNFKTLINGSMDRHVWWLHCDDHDYALAFIRALRQAFPESALFLSGAVVASVPEREVGRPVIRISAWTRTPLDTGMVVLVDDAKWLPAIAATCTAAHLHDMDRRVLWQAMAGGCAISCSDAHRLPKRGMGEAVLTVGEPESVMETWREYASNPILARSLGDGARRYFWGERRLAAEVNEELLQRVFEW